MNIESWGQTTIPRKDGGCVSPLPLKCNYLRATYLGELFALRNVEFMLFEKVSL